MQTRGDARVPWATDFGLTAYWLKLPAWNSAFPQPWLSLTPDDPEEPPLIFVWFWADVIHDLTPLTWLYQLPSERHS